ncbi:MAG: aminopeptidase [Caldilineaceae bacterium]|nr:aminopeptidase [Caldilineaceae bacterium]
MDKRWRQLADILVNYSVKVAPGERVMIAMGEVETFPLTHALYEACIRAGAYPQVQFLSETLRHSLLKHGDEAQLGWTPEIEAQGMAWADVYYGLRGAYNLHMHDDIPAGRLAINQAAMGRVSTLRWQQTRWCLVRVPNEAFAFQAGVDHDTIEEMFFAACLLDWEQESKKWARWAERLNQGKTVRLVGKETDLTFSTEGRRWMVGDGTFNMPDGEIATAPVTETLHGYVTFEWPGVLGGRLMHDMRLRWEHGSLVHASASTNEAYLERILATDAGASLLGEFAMGTNPHVDRFCKDILIDEKIGGTVHMALGRAYPESGGTNQSAIHWDIIKDIRQEGAVYVDGQVVLEGGRFFLDD